MFFCRKKHNSFAEKKTYFFAENVIARIRVYTFRPTKNLGIELELGYLFLTPMPGTRTTRKPVKFPKKIFSNQVLKIRS